MIWFGGVGAGSLNSKAFHVTLNISFAEDDAKTFQSGNLTIRALYNNKGEEVSLKQPDRFFYNQEFYLQKPTQQLIEMGFGYQGKYTMKWFNKNRFIGVVGREAFHVFDLEMMDFIVADPERGYVVNIDPSISD